MQIAENFIDFLSGIQQSYESNQKEFPYLMGTERNLFLVCKPIIPVQIFHVRSVLHKIRYDFCNQQRKPRAYYSEKKTGHSVADFFHCIGSYGENYFSNFQQLFVNFFRKRFDVNFNFIHW